MCVCVAFVGELCPFIVCTNVGKLGKLWRASRITSFNPFLLPFDNFTRWILLAGLKKCVCVCVYVCVCCG